MSFFEFSHTPNQCARYCLSSNLSVNMNLASVLNKCTWNTLSPKIKIVTQKIIQIPKKENRIKTAALRYIFLSQRKFFCLNLFISIDRSKAKRVCVNFLSIGCKSEKRYLFVLILYWFVRCFWNSIKRSMPMNHFSYDQKPPRKWTKYKALNTRNSEAMDAIVKSHKFNWISINKIRVYV